VPGSILLPTNQQQKDSLLFFKPPAMMGVVDVAGFTTTKIEKEKQRETKRNKEKQRETKENKI